MRLSTLEPTERTAAIIRNTERKSAGQLWQGGGGRGADCGVLICGTGVGISIAANKVNGVRAAVCSDTATARLVKEHNNANIIAFGARIVGTELAKDIVKAYLDAEFQGGRHQTRIDMIHEIEKRNA